MSSTKRHKTARMFIRKVYQYHESSSKQFHESISKQVVFLRAHQPLERHLANQQVRALLKLADLAQSDRTGPIAAGLLDALLLWGPECSR